MSMARSSRADLGRNGIFLLLLGLGILVPSLVLPGRQHMATLRPLLVEAVALCLLVLMTSRVTWSRAAVNKFFRTGPNLAILLFLGWSALTYFDSPYKSYGLQQLLALGGGAIIYFAVVYRLASRRHLQKLTTGLIASVILSVLLGCVLFSQQTGGKMASAFGNSQLFASFLVAMLPLILVVSQADDNGLRRSAGQFALVLAVAALLMTQNRSAWLGAIAGLALLGVLAMRSGSGSRSLARYKHQVLVPGLVILGAVGLFFLFSGTLSNFLERAGTGADQAFKWRLDMWAIAGKEWIQRPIQGWGIGSFPYFAAYMGANTLPRLAGAAPTLSDMAHNQYLQILSETGIVGLALYLSVLVAFFWRCAKALRESGSTTRNWLMMGSMAAVAAMAVDAIGNPSWQFAQVSLFFWLVLGIGVAASRPREDRELAEEAPQAARPAPATWRQPARVGWAMAQACAVAAILFVAGKAYADNPAAAVCPADVYPNLQACFLAGFDPAVAPGSPLILDVPPLGETDNCYTIQFEVTQINNPGDPPTTVDVTLDPNTTLTIDNQGTCFNFQPAPAGHPGIDICVPATNPCFTPGAQAGPFTLTGTFNLNGDPNCSCQATMPVFLNGVRGRTGHHQGGGGGGGGVDTGGGGGGGAIIGAIAGIGLLALLLLGRRKHHGKKGDHGDEGCDEGKGEPKGDSKGDSKVSLPPFDKVTAIRTDPPQLEVKLDKKDAQELKVLVQLDGKDAWYEVTNHPDTEFYFDNGSARLVQRVGEMDKYLVKRDGSTTDPLKIRVTFHDMTAETPVSFNAPVP